MNRMAILCTFVVLGLTTVVLLDQRRGDDGGVLPDGRARADTPAAAPSAGLRPGPEIAPRVDRRALEVRLQREVVAPLAEGWTRRLSFSRARQPTPDLSLRMQPTEERGPREEDAERYTYFEIDQTPNRHPRDDRPPTPWMRGRVARDGGAIELALLRAGTWTPAPAMIEALSGKRR